MQMIIPEQKDNGTRWKMTLNHLMFDVLIGRKKKTSIIEIIQVLWKCAQTRVSVPSIPELL